MDKKPFPVIDPVATGKNILRLRTERGMTVRDLQTYFGFEEPQAIYKWQQGKSLPSVDNLYALGALLEVPMEEILVSRLSKVNLIDCEQQANACCSSYACGAALRLWGIRQNSGMASTIFAQVTCASRPGALHKLPLLYAPRGAIQCLDALPSPVIS